MEVGLFPGVEGVTPLAAEADEKPLVGGRTC